MCARASLRTEEAQEQHRQLQAADSHPAGVANWEQNDVFVGAA